MIMNWSPWTRTVWVDAVLKVKLLKSSASAKPAIARTKSGIKKQPNVLFIELGTRISKANRSCRVKRIDGRCFPIRNENLGQPARCDPWFRLRSDRRRGSSAYFDRTRVR